VLLPPEGAVKLWAQLDGEALRFSVEAEGFARVPVGPALDATLLSDDRVIENGSWGFTGCFIVLCAQDSTDSGLSADFSRFVYDSATPVVLSLGK